MEIFRKKSKLFVIVLSLVMISASILSFNLPDSNAASSYVAKATAKVNASGGAYLRKSTTTSSDKIVLIKDNATVTINKEIFASKTSTDATKRWFSVTYNGKTGYMRADVLDSFSYSGVKGTVTGTLNYRVGAGTGMTKKGTLKKGSTVSVVLEAKASGSSDLWYKIKSGSSYYFVSGKYVTIGSTSSNSSSSSSSSSSNNSNSSSSSGSSRSSSTTTNSKLSATAKVDASSGAYMRKSASTTSDKVVLLKNNAEITVLKEVFVSTTSLSKTQRWYQISSGSSTGYIRADLLKSFSYTGLKGTATGTLNYRAGAGTSMTKKGTLSKGTSVDVLLEASASGSSDTWYKIRYNSSIYYVSGKYVSLSSTAVTYTEANSSSNSSSDSNSSSNSSSDSSSNGSASNTTPVFTVSNLSCPTSIGETLSYNLKGTVTCTVNMTKVKIGFVDSSGNWVQSVTKNLNSKTFDVSSVDSSLKFGSLSAGKYTFRADFYIGTTSYTKISKGFTVSQLSWPTKIANTAISLCWPVGTSASKYKYGSGSPTTAYKNALNAAYPNRSNWGAAPKVGASCDVFVGTSIRTSGYDSSFPRGLGNMTSGQWAHLSKSDKWQEVPYSYKESQLQSGDVIIYQRYSGSEHICIYVKINGKGYLAEAAIKTYYGHLTKVTSGSKIFKSSDKKKFKVYRAVS